MPDADDSLHTDTHDCQQDRRMQLMIRLLRLAKMCFDELLCYKNTYVYVVIFESSHRFLLIIALEMKRVLVLCLIATVPLTDSLYHIPLTRTKRPTRLHNNHSSNAANQRLSNEENVGVCARTRVAHLLGRVLWADHTGHAGAHVPRSV
jgi:hypothetical protein